MIGSNSPVAKPAAVNTSNQPSMPAGRPRRVASDVEGQWFQLMSPLLAPSGRSLPADWDIIPPNQPISRQLIGMLPPSDLLDKLGREECESKNLTDISGPISIFSSELGDGSCLAAR